MRLWPIPGGDIDQLKGYLKSKLRMDESFIKDELGEVEIRRVRDQRNRKKDEYLVTFESKQIRDTVKAAAPNLANFRDEAGMRLHVPDHLQKEFQALMNISYDLKKRHPNLKRNVKFDEDDLGLFMDVRPDEGKEWKRIKPSQATHLTKRKNKSRTADLGDDELKSMLGDESD